MTPIKPSALTNNSFFKDIVMKCIKSRLDRIKLTTFTILILSNAASISSKIINGVASYLK